MGKDATGYGQKQVDVTPKPRRGVTRMVRRRQERALKKLEATWRKEDKKAAQSKED